MPSAIAREWEGGEGVHAGLSFWLSKSSRSVACQVWSGEFDMQETTSKKCRYIDEMRGGAGGAREEASGGQLAKHAGCTCHVHVFGLLLIVRRTFRSWTEARRGIGVVRR